MSRFATLEKKLDRKGVKDPGALAASIGRDKYGQKKMTAMSMHGRGMAHGGMSDDDETTDMSGAAKSHSDDMVECRHCGGLTPGMAHGGKVGKPPAANMIPERKMKNRDDSVRSAFAQTLKGGR